MSGQSPRGFLHRHVPPMWMLVVVTFLVAFSAAPTDQHEKWAVGTLGPKSKSPDQLEHVFLWSFRARGEGWMMAPHHPGRELVFPPSSLVPPERRGIGRVESHGTKVQKRSYQRCQRRLEREGFAVYKGRHGVVRVASPTCPAPVRLPARPGDSRRQRAAVFCWNAQSLTTTYVELLQWLHHQQISFALIQSTGWTLTEPWTS